MSGSAAAAGGFEVPQPILNGPFDAPAEHWLLQEGEPPQRVQGRRPSGYWYRDPRRNVQDAGGSRGVWREMTLVNAVRARVDEWRRADRPGITRTTAELLAWWERDGRYPRLFFAQREAVETIIFLTEARPDFCKASRFRSMTHPMIGSRPAMWRSGACARRWRPAAARARWPRCWPRGRS